MQPFAYAGLTNPPYTHHPRDDYYFADFLSRIHLDDPRDGNTTPTQLAFCNEVARYPDGIYQVKISVTDVAGTIHEGPKNTNGGVDPYEFVIDNYRPYIREVTFNVSTIILYYEEWECNNNCVQFSNNTEFNTVSSTTIKETGFDVQASEPLTECYLSIDAFDISNEAMDPDPNLPDGIGFMVLRYI
jgi:hypothetical protein